MGTSNRLSRRRFCQQLAAGIGVAAIGARASSRSLAQAEENGSFQGYIDVHTHLGQTWNVRPALTAEELLRWMDAHQITQAVVLPLINPEASSYPLTTDFVLAETRPYRDRLIPFCSIDPRTSYQGGQQGLRDMLSRYKEAGAKGFGEHKPGVPIDDPGNMQLFEACGALKLPVLFHLDNQRNMDKPGLPGLAKVLEQNPDTIFIGHGPGWWASISGDVQQADLGGYPKGPIAPGGAIDALMDQFPNIYGDLSAGSGANAISRDLAAGRDFLIRRADRIMFGTDYLAPEQGVPQFELFEQHLELPLEVRNKIFRDNARRVLRLQMR